MAEEVPDDMGVDWRSSGDSEVLRWIIARFSGQRGSTVLLSLLERENCKTAVTWEIDRSRREASITFLKVKWYMV
jgi:hypothetical protein